MRAAGTQVLFTPVRNEGSVALKQTNLSSKCWLPIDSKAQSQQGDIFHFDWNSLYLFYSSGAQGATKHPANHSRQDGRKGPGGPRAAGVYIADAPSYSVIEGKQLKHNTDELPG